MAASFIDMQGVAVIPVLFRFSWQKFHVGMTEVGGMSLRLGAEIRLGGNEIGGALEDQVRA